MPFARPLLDAVPAPHHVSFTPLLADGYPRAASMSANHLHTTCGPPADLRGPPVDPLRTPCGQVSTDQWSWLRHCLNVSTAEWIIVVGNDPMWSVGDHGPTWGLVTALLPLLQASPLPLRPCFVRLSFDRTYRGPSTGPIEALR